MKMFGPEKKKTLHHIQPLRLQQRMDRQRQDQDACGDDASGCLGVKRIVQTWKCMFGRWSFPLMMAQPGRCELSVSEALKGNVIFQHINFQERTVRFWEDRNHDIFLETVWNCDGAIESTHNSTYLLFQEGQVKKLEVYLSIPYSLIFSAATHLWFRR